MKSREALGVVAGQLVKLPLSLSDHQKLAACVKLIESALPEEKEADEQSGDAGEVQKDS